MIVVPCFNEEQVFPLTYGKLSALLQGMVSDGAVSDSSRIFFVDDGSRDRTWEFIVKANQESPYVCGLKLAHNSGHQNALMAGTEATVGAGADAVITIDADLQDDVDAIPEMVWKYTEGYDVVYGVRRERKTDTWFKKFSALMFYRIARAMGMNLVSNHADFRLLSAAAAHRLLEYRERNLFIRGIVPSLSDNTAEVYYDRGKREAGASKYPFRKMAHFAADGVTSFSVKPLKAMIWFGLLFILIALGILCYVLVSYFTGNAVSGWSSLMLSVWFIGGCILIGLGIVGEYIGKVFLEVKDRPRYSIDKVLIK